MAQHAPGCLDFSQSPDPIETDRINIFERWESDEQLAAFRALPGDNEVTVPPAPCAATYVHISDGDIEGRCRRSQPTLGSLHL